MLLLRLLAFSTLSAASTATVGLPAPRRQLGLRRFNPLSCVAAQLNEGDSLLPGEAVCYTTDEFGPDSAKGAFEFGLDFDGKLVYYDHRTYDPAVAVWKKFDKAGRKLALTSAAGGILVLTDDRDEVVWQLVSSGGDCEAITAEAKEMRSSAPPRDEDEGSNEGGARVTVSAEGLVEVHNGEGNAIWSVDLAGVVRDGCDGPVPTTKAMEGSSGSDRSGLTLASSVMAGILLAMWI